MRDINCLQRLSCRNNRVSQAVALLHREEGIHKHGVLLAVDQCRRIGHPHQRFLAGRHITVEAGTGGGKHLVSQRRLLAIRTCHCHSRHHRKHDQGCQFHHIAALHAKPRIQELDAATRGAANMFHVKDDNHHPKVSNQGPVRQRVRYPGAGRSSIQDGANGWSLPSTVTQMRRRISMPCRRYSAMALSLSENTCRNGISPRAEIPRATAPSSNCA